MLPETSGPCRSVCNRAGVTSTPGDSDEELRQHCIGQQPRPVSCPQFSDAGLPSSGALAQPLSFIRKHAHTRMCTICFWSKSIKLSRRVHAVRVSQPSLAWPHMETASHQLKDLKTQVKATSPSTKTAKTKKVLTGVDKDAEALEPSPAAGSV